MTDVILNLMYTALSLHGDVIPRDTVRTWEKQSREIISTCIITLQKYLAYSQFLIYENPI